MNGISTETKIATARITEDTDSIVRELLSVTRLAPGSILVVGCSSSEVDDHRIGSYSSASIGQLIFDVIYQITNEQHLYLAAQCCEHLNRALIIEQDCALKYHLPLVNVVPKLKAGGSFATAAYHGMTHAVAVEAIQADAGIDIGDTLIGMHLKTVAVPVRTARQSIGNAHVVCARTRYKYIGGERASYDDELS